ncbi:LysR family transcriptional regulator [Metallumcola ferriviriculae]|uniref:LysR family transcriptional regulator n=1 Tax=Metallumcola ferriviriculae TaxID=3039180 RepID=A0AAU0USE7_9FIRM|nr:LysR family transcriptional regulator [Desulfitibacteraceae bacterium MK1]
MQINQLEIFCMVAQIKSFSKAAKLLYMTQPAVSNHIISMENYYGAKLFHRHSYGVSLTEVGDVVYKHSQKLLDLHDAMEKEIDKVLSKENRKLVVGASSTIGNYTLPCSIWAFKEKYPTVDISLEIGNSATIIKTVLNNQVNLAVVEGPINHKDLEATDVFQDELILITPPKGKWLDIQEITLTEIKKEPLIIREQGSGIRKLWEEFLQSNGLDLTDLQVVTEMGSIDAIKSAVESGLGVAIVSKLSVKKEIRRATLREVKIKDIVSDINFQIIYRPEKNQPTITKRFIRFLTVPEERSFC